MGKDYTLTNTSDNFLYLESENHQVSLRVPPMSKGKLKKGENNASKVNGEIIIEGGTIG